MSINIFESCICLAIKVGSIGAWLWANLHPFHIKKTVNLIHSFHKVSIFIELH